MIDRLGPARSRLALRAIGGLALCLVSFLCVVSRAARTRRGPGQDRALSRHLGRRAHLRSDGRRRPLRHGLGPGRGPSRAAPAQPAHGHRRVRRRGGGGGSGGRPPVAHVRSLRDREARLPGASPRAALGDHRVRRRHQRLLRRASRRRSRLVAARPRGRRGDDPGLGSHVPLQLVDRRGVRRSEASRHRALVRGGAARLESVRDRAQPQRRGRGHPRHRSASLLVRAQPLLGSAHPCRRARGQRREPRRLAVPRSRPHAEPRLGDDHRRSRHRGRLRARARHDGRPLSLRRSVARPRAPRDHDRGARRRAASRDDPAVAPRAAHRQARNEGVGGEDRLPRRGHRVRGDLGAQLRRRLQGRASARWRCACSSRRT